MSFIDPMEEHELRRKLTNDASQLGKLYKSKKSYFHIKSVDHNLAKSFLNDGWEEFGKPLKTKTRLRKSKSHKDKFEDDVWCQFYELGFRHLNFTNDFKLHI